MNKYEAMAELLEQVSDLLKPERKKICQGAADFLREAAQMLAEKPTIRIGKYWIQEADDGIFITTESGESGLFKNLEQAIDTFYAANF